MAVFTIQQTGEKVSTTWRELFTIQFKHAWFETTTENFLSKGIRIVPDEDTQQLFTGHKIRYRFFGSSLVCFMQCIPFNPPDDEPKIPFVTVGSDLTIRFLVFSSSDFADKTFVVPTGSKQVYLFTNKVNNQSGGQLMLTSPFENYSPATDYPVGSVVQSGSQLYGAIMSSAGADNIPLSDTDYWKLLPTAPVVNNADLQDRATVKNDIACFAVIDLYKNGTTNNSYRLFDTNDQIFKPAPVFTIQFASRP